MNKCQQHEAPPSHVTLVKEFQSIQRQWQPSSSTFPSNHTSSFNRQFYKKRESCMEESKERGRESERAFLESIEVRKVSANQDFARLSSHRICLTVEHCSDSIPKYSKNSVPLSSCQVYISILRSLIRPPTMSIKSIHPAPFQFAVPSQAS